jgi:hypothetical protein
MSERAKSIRVSFSTACARGIRQLRVQARQRRAQVAHQHHVALRRAA